LLAMTAVTCVNVADAASDFERFGKKTEGKHIRIL
jgi:hypothetical protein